MRDGSGWAHRTTHSLLRSRAVCNEFEQELRPIRRTDKRLQLPSVSAMSVLGPAGISNLQH